MKLYSPHVNCYSGAPAGDIGSPRAPEGEDKPETLVIPGCFVATVRSWPSGSGMAMVWRPQCKTAARGVLGSWQAEGVVRSRQRSWQAAGRRKGTLPAQLRHSFTEICLSATADGLVVSNGTGVWHTLSPSIFPAALQLKSRIGGSITKQWSQAR